MKKLRAALERLQKVGRSPRRPLRRIGLYIRRDAQRRLRGRKHDWGRPSGRLSQSLAMLVDDASVTVGSNLVYAAVQQLGHPGIKPKRGRYLALPVLPSLRRRGVWPRDLPRGSMKFVRYAEIKIGAHAWRGPALVRAEGASGDGDGKKRKGAAREPGEVMFALVKQVRVRGEPYLVFDRRAQAFALQEFAREYREALKG